VRAQAPERLGAGSCDAAMRRDGHAAFADGMHPPGDLQTALGIEGVCAYAERSSKDVLAAGIGHSSLVSGSLV
jgi:hypothetical protein